LFARCPSVESCSRKSASQRGPTPELIAGNRCGQQKSENRNSRVLTGGILRFSHRKYKERRSKGRLLVPGGYGPERWHRIGRALRASGHTARDANAQHVYPPFVEVEQMGIEQRADEVLNHDHQANP